ncbi:MAG: FtsW/RodA/SpoVE family cell cycle protein [Anaerolineaceae bacterium]|jgi:cell division protein FtsW|nr:FtsW/RodA/SpoVE family cell cycle protein [Anaerolineaceae bacterium]
MGSTTPIKINKSTQPAIKIPFLKTIDFPLVLIVLALYLFGLVILYSASMPMAYYASEPTTPWNYVSRQAIFGLTGLAGAFFIAWIDYRVWKKFMLPALLATWAVLFLVLIVGSFKHGSTRTFFDGSVQPSEISKVLIILYLSFWIKEKQESLKKFTFWVVPIGFIIGGTGVLLALEPDFSAVLTLVMISGIILFLSNLDWKQIVLIGCVAVLTFFIIIRVTSTGSTRWGQFITGYNDPHQALTQVKRSIESVVNGGFFGVGIGQGTVKFTGLEVGQSDTIFTVIAEELGLMGSIVVIILFLLLLWRGFKISLESENLAGRLIAGGISSWIVLEAFINVASLFNIVPIGGNTLPFFSLGGSSLVSILTGIGFILSVGRVNQIKKIQERSSYSAVVDLRWRDRRRSVPRTRRPASHGRQL